MTSILVIDDEKVQAEGLAKALQVRMPHTAVRAAFEEKTILEQVEDWYYNIAIVDLRMDNFTIDGIIIIRKILQVNPFAKIIVVSGYLPDYESQLEFFKTGKIIATIEKGGVEAFTEKIVVAIKSVEADYEQNPQLNQTTLETLFAEAKNEPDAYQKGLMFEKFVGFLFGQMGFQHIQKRVIDVSRNEIDLVVRNEIDDLFFQKFSPYFFIECKNTSEKVNKGQFVEFEKKLSTSNGLANLGFIVTSNVFTEEARKEAIRSSKENYKVVFIGQPEIAALIRSNHLLQTLKQIIDNQVKDN